MDFSYTPEQRRLIERVRELYEFIKPFELECEMDNGLSDAVHGRIRQAVLNADLQAVNMPREWGGAGLTTMEQILYHEVLGRLTNALWDTVWRPANALKACTPEQRERYLLPGIVGEKRDAIAVTEEHAGSDPLAMTTTAVKRGDKYILNGEKWFVTVGDVADFILTLAWVDQKPTLFIVDRDAPGLSVKRTPKYTHTFVYEHPEFRYEDVELGSEQILGEIGQGYDLIRDWFVEERLMIGARTVGAATRAIEESVDFATGRIQGGSTLINHQLIQAMLADMVVDTTGARTLVYQVGDEIDRGELDRKTLHAKAAVVKLAASEAAGRVVDNAVQIHGGRGYMRDFAVERLYRELRVDRVWEGTSEIQRLIIGNEIAKRGVDGLLAFPSALSPELVYA
ncbi:MAG: acyl-CoA dehydrogenase family protein [Actinomycetes bacterium]